MLMHSCCDEDQQMAVDAVKMLVKQCKLSWCLAIASLVACSNEDFGRRVRRHLRVVSAGSNVANDGGAPDNGGALLPRSRPLDTFNGLLNSTWLGRYLATGQRDWTLFAPTDDAFSSLPHGAQPMFAAEWRLRLKVRRRMRHAHALGTL